MKQPNPSEFGFSESQIFALRQEQKEFEDARKSRVQGIRSRFLTGGAILGATGGACLCLFGLLVPNPNEPTTASGFICGFVILLPVLAFLGMLGGLIAGEVAEGFVTPKPPHRFDKLLEFEKALTEWKNFEKRRAKEFWLSLNGWEFERELARIYRSQSYEVEETPGSGDGGVDLILRLDEKKWIVQCKQHCKPVGPATVRELYGTMIAANADAAILACTSGFTEGVHQFAKDKPIELVDVDGILRMQEALD